MGGRKEKALLFPPKIMRQQVHRVSARWPACRTHNCFPSGVWSTQSLAICQRRATTHKLAYFWWHRPSRHCWSAPFRMAEENMAFICKLPAADSSSSSGPPLSGLPFSAGRSPRPSPGQPLPTRSHRLPTNARLPSWKWANRDTARSHAAQLYDEPVQPAHPYTYMHTCPQAAPIYKAGSKLCLSIWGICVAHFVHIVPAKTVEAPDIMDYEHSLSVSSFLWVFFVYFTDGFFFIIIIFYLMPTGVRIDTLRKLRKYFST